MDIQNIYKRRFNKEIEFRNKMWAVLCREFLQKYIPQGATVIDIAAGYCEFINNIRGGAKNCFRFKS